MEARKIELKVIEDTKTKLEYRDLIEGILTRPHDPRSGMALPEIRRCNKVLDQLEKADGHLVLSEELWTFLKDRVETIPFNVGGKYIEQFANDIANAPKITLEPVEGK